MKDLAHGTATGESAGVRVCAERGWDFAEVFRHQFRLSRDTQALCDDWLTLRLGRWVLHHCPDLPRTEILGALGERLAVVLGVAVDGEGRLLRDHAMPGGVGGIDALERYIEGLAGRFLVIVTGFDVERVYFDPSGGLSAVYAPTEGAVASSLHVLLQREIEPNPDVSAEAVRRREAQFLLGEAADRHTRRIRANHYLDLASFQMVRHWPRPDASFDEDGLPRAALIEGIAGRLAQIMEALSADQVTALPLSGGTDSRILLAAARGCLDRIGHFYVHDIYKVTEFDRLAATRLARELGLPLQVLHRATDGFDRLDDGRIAELRDKMVFRTSLSFDGIDDATVRAVACAPPADLVLRGNLAEMTRANKWSRDLAGKVVTPEQGLMFLTGRTVDDLRREWPSGRFEALRAGYEDWSRGLPGPAWRRLPDLAHVEVFAPAAPNNAYYAFDRSFYMNPFNDRGILHLTMRAEPLARMRREIVDGLIARLLPEISRLPYARYYKRMFRKMRAQGVELRDVF